MINRSIWLDELCFSESGSPHAFRSKQVSVFRMVVCRHFPWRIQFSVAVLESPSKPSLCNLPYPVYAKIFWTRFPIGFEASNIVLFYCFPHEEFVLLYVKYFVRLAKPLFFFRLSPHEMEVFWHLSLQSLNAESPRNWSLIVKRFTALYLVNKALSFLLFSSCWEHINLVSLLNCYWWEYSKKTSMPRALQVAYVGWQRRGTA